MGNQQTKTNMRAAVMNTGFMELARAREVFVQLLRTTRTAESEADVAQMIKALKMPLNTIEYHFKKFLDMFPVLRKDADDLGELIRRWEAQHPINPELTRMDPMGAVIGGTRALVDYYFKFGYYDGQRRIPATIEHIVFIADSELDAIQQSIADIPAEIPDSEEMRAFEARAHEVLSDCRRFVWHIKRIVADVDNLLLDFDEWMRNRAFESAMVHDRRLPVELIREVRSYSLGAPDLNPIRAMKLRAKTLRLKRKTNHGRRNARHVGKKRRS